MLKPSEIPWQIPVLLAMLFLFVALGLGIAGYEITGPHSKERFGIIERVEASAQEEALTSRMNMACAVINNSFDWGRAYEMESSNNCNAVCGAQIEDKKSCSGMIMINATGSHAARSSCEHTLDQSYIKNGDRPFCCCN